MNIILVRLYLRQGQQGSCLFPVIAELLTPFDKPLHGSNNDESSATDTNNLQFMRGNKPPNGSQPQSEHSGGGSDGHRKRSRRYWGHLLDNGSHRKLAPTSSLPREQDPMSKSQVYCLFVGTCNSNKLRQSLFARLGCSLSTDAVVAGHFLPTLPLYSACSWLVNNTFASLFKSETIFFLLDVTHHSCSCRPCVIATSTNFFSDKLIASVLAWVVSENKAHSFTQ